MSAATETIALEKAIATQTDRTRHERLPKWLRALTITLLIVLSGVFMYPFLWLISASLKPRADVFDNRLIPETIAFENYITIWQNAPMAAWLLNTVIVTTLAAVTVTISSAMVAWGFAHFLFRGRGVPFGFVLATMMLPGAVTMIPTYLIWDGLGLTGTLVPLWAGNLFGSAFYIFLLRQFFLGLPRELFDAARLDGASNWRMFRSIALPLCKPALIVTLLFEAQAAWTDLMKPLIYLRDTASFTVPRGLKQILDQFGLTGSYDWQLVVTASVITTLPLIVLFFIGQKQFTDGIATTGGR